MRKLINSLLFIALTFVSTNSFSYSSDPKIFITELVGDAIKTLSDKNISKVDKSKKIETIALENLDIDALSMYTLGSARKTLDEETLKKWHQLGFGGKSNKIKPFEIDDNCNIWYMNGNLSELDNWEINIKNNYVSTWSNNGKNDSVESKIKIGDIIAWYIVSKGYNSILKVIDNPHKITDENYKLTMTEEQIKNKKECMKKNNYSIVTIPVEFLATTTTNFIKKDNINDYTGEWSGGLRGCHCIKPNNSQWKELVIQIYNNLK